MEVVSSIHLMHLIFVDDVIVFGKNYVEEWKYLHKIQGIFCLSSHMEVNP